MSKKWSDDLRRRMETHEEPSPEGLWANIEQIIKQEDFINTPPKENKLLLWSKRVGAVAAVVLLMLLIGDYFMTKSTRQQVITNNTQTSYEVENDFSADQHTESNLIVENTTNSIFAYSSIHTPALEVKDTLGLKNKNRFITEVEEKEEYKKEPEKDDSRSESNIEKKVCNNHSNSKKQNQVYNNGNDLYNFPSVKNSSRSAKWETSLYASNISSNSIKKDEGYGSFVSGDVLTESDGEEPALGEDPHVDILIQNKYREVYTDIKHKQPIIIGVSAHYNINENWSLTSGLTYTMLSSELRSGSDSYYYTSEQTLHNIGIPLNINYNLWHHKKTSIYLSVGTLVEKNISGKLITDYIVDNQFVSSQKDKISVDRLQWSLNSSLGVQYNISSRIGLYAEPGASYHFKNGSEVETIYKEKPLNLSLRFGFRFSLSGK